MSKKHQEKQVLEPAARQGHTAEYRIIRSDLIKVIALNIVYLAFVLSLYYANNKNGSVDAWFSRILHF